jgi:hypothetical protein
MPPDKERGMRNWMLTPIIVAGLVGVGLDFRNPRRDPALSAHADGLVVLAGSQLSLRQLGPVRESDDDVVVALRHHGGPAPDALRAWLAVDQLTTAAFVQAIAPGAVTVLSVPLHEGLQPPRLWLEATVGHRSGRAAFELET